jgi:hypothetical protein
MSYGTIFNKGGSDNTLVINTRTIEFVGFQAPDWMDLRVGFLLSLTSATDNDTITGLGEIIGGSPGVILDWNDRLRIGLTDSLTGTTFLGYTNRSSGTRSTTQGQSRLTSSDGGIGTSNSNFWRPNNYHDSPGDQNLVVQITDQDITQAISTDGAQIHFPQNAGGAGGYATLLALRFQRATPTTTAISMSFKSDLVNHSGDILFSNTPTADVLQNNLQSFPASVQLMGPITMSQMPDTIMFYWPFTNSRLRIHARGIVKMA